MRIMTSLNHPAQAQDPPAHPGHPPIPLTDEDPPCLFVDIAENNDKALRAGKKQPGQVA